MRKRIVIEFNDGISVRIPADTSMGDDKEIIYVSKSLGWTRNMVEEFLLKLGYEVI